MLNLEINQKNAKEFLSFRKRFRTWKLKFKHFKKSFYLQSKRLLFAENQGIFICKPQVNRIKKSFDFLTKKDEDHLLKLKKHLDNFRFHFNNNFNLKVKHD